MEYKLIRKEEVNSTNSDLLTMIRDGMVGIDTVLVSDYQMHGRGQGNHGWESEKGNNILMSWYIQPEFLSASDQFMLSKVVSLALIDHLNGYLGNTYIKWPNDILSGTKKIAGILIEHTIMQSRISQSIVGVGFNVNQEAFPAYPVVPTSLSIETGRHFDLEKQLRKLLKSLYVRYNQLRSRDYASIDEEYLEHLFRYRKRSLFESDEGKFEGVITGVNEYGQLLVEVSGEVRVFNFQEIRILFN